MQIQRSVLRTSLVLLLLLSISIPHVSAVAPVAGFAGTPLSGPVPLTVSFTDASLNLPTGWAWFFGDESYAAPWTQETAGAGWTARDSHGSVALPDGSIVMMGGYGTVGGYHNDVWRSTDNGVSWALVNPGAGWSARLWLSSIAVPDGSIVLTGGTDSGGTRHNDIWRSTDNGITWTSMNVSGNPGWAARDSHSMVAMPDGGIVVMGGRTALGSGFLNDVWRSTDNGATWIQETSGAGWTARHSLSSVAMPDGSIVVMGGLTSGGRTNDTWRSVNYGVTWTQVNASSGWAGRSSHSSTAMPDSSIVLMGGNDGINDRNDTWRSTDNGATWTQVTASAGWTPRHSHSSVAMPDGSIILTGGASPLPLGYRNDVWRFMPVGSSAQNPSHTYTANGIYPVALQAFNADGYNSTRIAGYITVSGSSAPIASFTGTPLYGTAPLTVSFTDLSTGTPTSWNWSFGDGTYSGVRNPVHSYLGTGGYTVTLTVNNTAGSSTFSYANFVYVTPVPTPLPDLNDNLPPPLSPVVTPVQAQIASPALSPAVTLVQSLTPSPIPPPEVSMVPSQTISSVISPAGTPARPLTASPVPPAVVPPAAIPEISDPFSLARSFTRLFSTSPDGYLPSTNESLWDSIRSGSGKIPPPLSPLLPDKYAPLAAVVAGILLTIIGTMASENATLSRWWDKIYGLLRKFLGSQVIRLINVNEIKRRGIRPSENLSSILFGLSPREILVIIISAMIFAAAFILQDHLEFKLVTVIIFVCMGGIATILRDIAQKYCAYRSGSITEYQFWTLGTATMLSTAWLFGTAFAKPSRTLIRSENIPTLEETARIKLAGPLMNMGVAIVSLFLIPLGGVFVIAGSAGFSMNLLNSVFSLIPVKYNEGADIYAWNKLLWAVVFIPMIILFLYVYM